MRCGGTKRHCLKLVHKPGAGQTVVSDAETSTAGWTIDDDAASLYRYGTSGWQWEDYSGKYNSKVFKYSINGTAVPVPGTLALLGAGGIVAARRRRR